MSMAEEIQAIEILGFSQGWTSSSITDSGSNQFIHKFHFPYETKGGDKSIKYLDFNILSYTHIVNILSFEVVKILITVQYHFKVQS